MYRAIVTCPIQEVLEDSLTSAGVLFDLRPEATYDELLNIIAEYEIMVISTSVQIDQNLLDQAKKLKVIGRLGSGLDHVDTRYAQKKGVEIISTPEANSRAVAEHVLAMLLSYNNHICRAQSEVKNGIWIRAGNTGTELLDKSIGIVGYGNNGSLTASILSSLGMQVKVYDPYVDIKLRDNLQPVATLEELMSDLDFLSFHVPLTEETRHYFDSKLMSLATKPLVLLNISRGEVVDSEYLLEALEEKYVTAALLDVIENEKSQTKNEVWVAHDKIQEALKRHQKIFITPHIAGYSHEAKYAMNRIIGEKISNFLKSF